MNIKENLKSFFLDDVISKIDKLRDEQGKMKYSLLILDNKTTKIIDKFISMMDLIEYGIIGVESLSKKRKQFLDFHAIYFISSDEKTLSKLLNDDFSEYRQGDPDPNVPFADKGGPLYQFVHLIFCEPIQEKTLQEISGKKYLVASLLSIYKINLDILTIDETLFSMDFNREQELKLLNKTIDEKESYCPLEQLSNQSLSIFTLLKKINCLQIIYEKTGAAQYFAQIFSQKSMDFVNKVNKVFVGEIPPVFLFILNRGSDLLDILSIDNSYASQLFNILNQIQFKITFDEEKDGEKTTIESLLNEKDSIWFNQKYNSFKNAKILVQKQLKEFVLQNTSQSKHLSPEDQVKRMPQYQEFFREFQKHLGAMANILKEQEKRNFTYVQKMEMGLLTGLDEKNDEFDMEKIDVKQIPDEYDKVRLALLSVWTGLLSPEEARTKFLDDLDTIQGFNKIIEEFKNAIVFPFDKLNKVDLQEDQNSTQYQPKIVEYLINFLKGNLFENKEMNVKFDKINIVANESQNQILDKPQFKQPAIYKNENKIPYIIFFVIGGITLSEVVAVNRIAEQVENYDIKVICGGTSFFTPYSFLANYLTTKHYVVQESESQIGNERQGKEEAERMENQEEQEQEKQIEIKD